MPNTKAKAPIRRRSPASARFVEGLEQTSYVALLLLWVSVVAWFAVLYTAASYVPDGHGLTKLEPLPLLLRFGNSLYFSIVTATGLGYGDLAPLGLSKWLASAEAMFGVVVLALFVTKLLSHRHDTALERIHRLSFQNMSFTTRQELYIVRKDFDAVMTEAERTAALTPRAWENLATAYRATQTVLASIMDFYEKSDGMYTIDAVREQLLQEATLRTLVRLDTLLTILTRQRVPWKRHDASVGELKKLIRIAEGIIRHWEAGSPYLRPDVFRELRRLTRRLHAHVSEPARAARRRPA